MQAAAEARLHVANSLSEAVAALAERGPSGAPLAGATWIMRAPLREERQDLSYVAISKIEELRSVDILGSEISIGSCVTHAELAHALAPLPECRALAQAAARSANPSIRGVATLGGNLCACGFAAADLVPALICLEAEVELARRMDLNASPWNASSTSAQVSSLAPGPPRDHSSQRRPLGACAAAVAQGGRLSRGHRQHDRDVGPSRRREAARGWRLVRSNRSRADGGGLRSI